MVKLKWGNTLNFESENEYYEVLGFLAKKRNMYEFIRRVMIKLVHGQGKGDFLCATLVCIPCRKH